MSTDVNRSTADPSRQTRPDRHPTSEVPWWTRGDTNAFFGLGLQHPGQRADPDRPVDLRRPGARRRRARHRAARARHRADRSATSTTRSWPAGWPGGRTGPTSPRCRTGRACRTCSSWSSSIMLPIFLSTGDPIRAWQAGLAWAFIIGVIVLIGAFVGPFIRKITPRAALLGTLAGISLTLHLDAAGRPDVGGGLDRPAGARASSWSASSPT